MIDMNGGDTSISEKVIYIRNYKIHEYLAYRSTIAIASIMSLKEPTTAKRATLFTTLL